MAPASGQQDLDVRAPTGPRRRSRRIFTDWPRQIGSGTRGMRPALALKRGWGGLAHPARRPRTRHHCGLRPTKANFFKRTGEVGAAAVRARVRAALGTRGLAKATSHPEGRAWARWRQQAAWPRAGKRRLPRLRVTDHPGGMALTELALSPRLDTPVHSNGHQDASRSA
jgi:hypothetical protein